MRRPPELTCSVQGAENDPQVPALTVKRVLLAAAPALVVAALLVAGPALSARPYTPEPLQFDVAAPAGEPPESGGRELVSEPLRAPKRFNMVGLTWSGAATPAAEASHSEFVHRHRRRGKRYTYRVTAQDRAEPANVSPPSADASATAG